ncbi:hypothetical protein Dimus_017296 [Dionaea muscipula]
MFRALSTRNNRNGYDRLEDNKSSVDEAELRRVVSVPAGGGGVYDAAAFAKVVKEPELLPLPTTKTQAKRAEKAAKLHPLFGLFDGKWGKKKMTARPEFSRYIQYLKEGGA